MAQAAGNRQYLAVSKEIVSGTVNTNPVLYKKRHTGGTLDSSRDTYESGEMRTDRGISEVRTGIDQPSAGIDMELSYGSFDDLYAGALGNDKIGGYSFTKSVDFGNGTAVITTNDASNWEDLGVFEGGTLYINGANTPANDGIYIITDVLADALTVVGADGVTAVTFTVDTADSISIIGGWYAVEITTSTGVIDLAVDNTAKTMTLSGSGGATFNTDRIQPGDWLVFNGFTNAGNNDTWFQVDVVSPTVITFVSTTTLVNETVVTATDISFTTNSGMISSVAQAGQVLPTYTVSEAYTDIALYRYAQGCTVGTWGLSFSTGAITTGSFGLEGLSISAPSATEISGATVVAEGTSSVMDGFTGELFVYDPTTDTNTLVPTCVVTGLDLSYDNNLQRNLALFQREACQSTAGRISLTGSLSLYLVDDTFMTWYNDETELVLKVRSVDLDGNCILLVMPRVKLTSESRSISESSVDESTDIQALANDTEFGTIGIIMQGVPA